ncbi:MAG: hypothetical protein VB934_19145 [Polyangiaceae bacterium]
MQRDTPLAVMAITQGLTSATALGFHFVVRPAAFQEYEHAGRDLPYLAVLFFGGMPLLAWVASAGLLGAVIVTLSPMSRGKKLRLLGAMVIVTGFAFVAAALGTLGPLL